jgi:hypothetical protein
MASFLVGKERFIHLIFISGVKISFSLNHHALISYSESVILIASTVHLVN